MKTLKFFIGSSDSDAVVLNVVKKYKNEKEKYINAFGFWTTIIAKRIAYIGSEGMNIHKISEDELENVVVRVIFSTPHGQFDCKFNKKINDNVYEFIGTEKEFKRAFKALIEHDIPRLWRNLQKYFDGEKIIDAYLKFVKPVFYVRYENGNAFGDSEMNEKNYKRFYENINKAL